MSVQILKKIGQKLLKSPETKRWRTDGRTALNILKFSEGIT